MKMHIYFIQAESGGPIKIGKATSVEQRLSSLQPCCPFVLVVLASVYADERLEAHLHGIFHQYRMHGEWFVPEAPILEWIIRREIRLNEWVSSIDVADDTSRSRTAKRHGVNGRATEKDEDKQISARRFSDALQSHRKRHGLTLTDAAKKIGVSIASVINWERRPTCPTGWARNAFIKAFPSLASTLPRI